MFFFLKLSFFLEIISFVFFLDIFEVNNVVVNFLFVFVVLIILNKL